MGHDPDPPAAAGLLLPDSPTGDPKTEAPSEPQPTTPPNRSAQEATKTEVTILLTGHLAFSFG